MRSVAAVILMGGRGSRLGGVDKGALEIGGMSLLQRVMAATAGCTPVLLATGSAARPAVGLQAIADLGTDYVGPLAGVAAAVAHLAGSETEILFSLAVDTPFFPRDFQRRAEALMAGADAVVGAFGAQDYPTNALWRLAALAGLPDAMRAGTAPHSLRRLAAGLRTVRLDYAEFVAADPFANANTPQDLTNLRRRAADERAG